MVIAVRKKEATSSFRKDAAFCFLLIKTEKHTLGQSMATQVHCRADSGCHEYSSALAIRTRKLATQGKRARPKPRDVALFYAEFNASIARALRSEFDSM